MIGSLEGRVEVLDEGTIIINIGGVGYKVLVPASVFSKLSTEQTLRLFTYTYVREDVLELFGFESFADLKLFELLISVSGIGPKTALGIFSVGNREAILEAVAKENVLFFSSVPRLGNKNAQKIIIELRGKIGNISGNVGLPQTKDELTDALKSFGFSTREVQQVISMLAEKGALEQDTATQVKLALKYLGK